MEERQCGSCGARSMVLATRDIVERYKGENFTVTAVRGWFCSACGESEFSSREDAEQFAREAELAMRKIDEGQRAEIRAIRKRLGLKQAEAAALFGGGVNAFSEYERGIRYPSRAMVLLLRILGHHPELLDEIKTV